MISIAVAIDATDEYCGHCRFLEDMFLCSLFNEYIELDGDEMRRCDLCLGATITVYINNKFPGTPQGH